MADLPESGIGECIVEAFNYGAEDMLDKILRLLETPKNGVPQPTDTFTRAEIVEWVEQLKKNVEERGT